MTRILLPRLLRFERFRPKGTSHGRRDEEGSIRIIHRSRGSVAVAWLVAGVMIGLAVVAIGFAVWKSRTAGKETVDRFAVVEATRKILKVATVETQVAEIVTYRDARPFLYFFSSEKNAIIRVRGKVLAGFDLTSKRIDIRIDQEAMLARVRLPRAQILAIDPTIEILDEHSGWRNVVTREDRNLWLKWARGDLRRAALDTGITARAERNVREILETLTQSYGLRLEVSFDGSEEPALPPLSVEFAPRN